MKLKIGDEVKVLTGSEKGKVGRLKQILKSKDRAIVEGLNVCVKHQKPSTRDESGSIVQRESPIHISNLMVCDSNMVASRIRVVKTGKNSERFSKKTGKKV